MSFSNAKKQENIMTNPISRLRKALQETFDLADDMEQFYRDKLRTDFDTQPADTSFKADVGNDLVLESNDEDDDLNVTTVTDSFDDDGGEERSTDSAEYAKVSPADDPFFDFENEDVEKESS